MPSVPMAIHESSRVAAASVDALRQHALDRSTTPSDANATTSAPEPCRKRAAREAGAGPAPRARRTSAAASCAPPVRVAADRLQHPGVDEAAAQHARQRLLHLGVGGARIAVEQRLGGQDHAAQAEAALRGLLVDERLLQRMRPSRACPRPSSVVISALATVLDRRDARPDRLAVRRSRCTRRTAPGRSRTSARAARGRRSGRRAAASPDPRPRGAPCPLTRKVKMAMKRAYNRRKKGRQSFKLPPLSLPAAFANRDTAVRMSADADRGDPNPGTHLSW